MIAIVNIEKNTIKIFRDHDIKEICEYLSDIYLEDVEQCCGNVWFRNPWCFKKGETTAEYDGSKIKIILNYEVGQEIDINEVRKELAEL